MEEEKEDVGINESTQNESAQLSVIKEEEAKKSVIQAHP
jgi:hypothetical protein